MWRHINKNDLVLLEDKLIEVKRLDYLLLPVYHSSDGDALAGMGRPKLRLLALRHMLSDAVRLLGHTWYLGYNLLSSST